MIVTVAPDLSEVTAVLPTGEWLRMGGFNPETQEPWVSPEAATEYALACVGRDGFWNSPDLPIDPPPPVPEVISDRQFFQALWKQDKITFAEALAAVQTGAIPAEMEGFLSMLEEVDAEGAQDARLLLSGATEFRRDNYLVPVFGSMYGMAASEIDDLWRLGATL